MIFTRRASLYWKRLLTTNLRVRNKRKIFHLDSRFSFYFVRLKKFIEKTFFIDFWRGFQCRRVSWIFVHRTLIGFFFFDDRRIKTSFVIFQRPKIFVQFVEKRNSDAFWSIWVLWKLFDQLVRFVQFFFTLNLLKNDSLFLLRFGKRFFLLIEPFLLKIEIRLRSRAIFDKFHRVCAPKHRVRRPTNYCRVRVAFVDIGDRWATRENIRPAYFSRSMSMRLLVVWFDSIRLFVRG